MYPNEVGNMKWEYDFATNRAVGNGCIPMKQQTLCKICHRASLCERENENEDGAFRTKSREATPAKKVVKMLKKLQSDVAALGQQEEASLRGLFVLCWLCESRTM